MKTALVHDWLVNFGGGEKALEAIWDLYPAPIHTLVKDFKRIKGTFFPDKTIHTSFLQAFPKASKYYRQLLPLFPLAIEQFDLSQYDIILSNSHAVAKGVLTHADQLHICYCLTPMRYAWDLYHHYLQGLGGIKGGCARLFLHYLRNWDSITTGRVDHFIAISHYIKRRIKRVYGRDSAVIYPPVATHLFNLREQKEEFYLALSRLVPYKKIDTIIDAFAKMPDKKLVVIGDGPEMAKVKAKATKNIEILGFQPDSIARDYLERAKALVFAAEEDFGIIVVEAQAAGTPVIAFGRGGVTETVIENKTGLFFDEQTDNSIIKAVNVFESKQHLFIPSEIWDHAQQFSESRFKSEFKHFVDSKIEEFYEDRYSCQRKPLFESLTR